MRGPDSVVPQPAAPLPDSPVRVETRSSARRSRARRSVRARASRPLPPSGHAPLVCPAVASPAFRAWRSRPGAPVAGGSACSTVLPAVWPVRPVLALQTAARFDHRLQGRPGCARPPRRRPVDYAPRALCPRVHTLRLSARLLRAGLACAPSTPNVLSTPIGLGCLRLA